MPTRSNRTVAVHMPDPSSPGESVCLSRRKMGLLFAPDLSRVTCRRCLVISAKWVAGREHIDGAAVESAR